MKKMISLGLLFVVLCLSGCTKNEGMYVEPAQLTQKEQKIAELLGLNTEHRIFDFAVDGTAQSIQVNSYELVDGSWSRVSGGGGCALRGTEGRVALGFDRIEDGLRIALQLPNGYNITTYNTVPETENSGFGRATSVLHDRTEVVYDQELPLVLQIETSKNEVRSFGVSSFEHPEELAECGYERVYAITILFSQNELS